MSLKRLIWTLSDFEFLASITSVDFRNRRVFIAPEFFNYLVGRTRRHFNANSKYEITSIITFIRRIYFTRLGLVSPHSMRRWFDRDMNVRYMLTKFFWKVDRYFTNLEKDNNMTRYINQQRLEEKKKKKNQKKKERRMRRRLAQQQQNPEQQPEELQSPSEDENEEVNHPSQDRESTSENESEEQAVNPDEEDESVSSEVAVHNVEDEQNDEIVRRKASDFNPNDEDDFNAYWDIVERTIGYSLDEDNDWDFVKQLLLGGVSPYDSIAINDEIRMRDKLAELRTQSEDEE